MKRYPTFIFQHQRGATLIFALLTLVALMLSTLALVRSTDIAALLMGNLGFKQDATTSADQATRQVIEWVTSNSAALNSDVEAKGYYASTKESSGNPVDATGTQLAGNATRQLIDWDNDSCAAAATGSYATCTLKAASIDTPINGNSASFVIFRMCDKGGDISEDATISCALADVTPGAANTPPPGDMNYGGMPINPNKLEKQPYYRIIVRMQGARNTVSYTETIVHY